MTYKEKCTNKSVYVVPPLAALIKIKSWGAPILFFAASCTQNFISLTTTDLILRLYNKLVVETKDFNISFSFRPVLVFISAQLILLFHD